MVLLDSLCFALFRSKRCDQSKQHLHHASVSSCSWKQITSATHVCSLCVHYTAVQAGDNTFPIFILFFKIYCAAAAFSQKNLDSGLLAFWNCRFLSSLHLAFWSFFGCMKTRETLLHLIKHTSTWRFTWFGKSLLSHKPFAWEPATRLSVEPGGLCAFVGKLQSFTICLMSIIGNDN